MTSAEPAPAMAAVRYTPGRWTGAVGARCLLLTDLAADAPLVERCWQLIDTGADAALVVAEIAQHGLRAIHSFVAITDAVVFVRGTAEVDLLDGAGGSVTISGQNALTWIEHHGATPPAGVVLRAGPAAERPAGSPSLPVTAGVVLADLLATTPVRATRAEPPQQLAPPPAPPPPPAPEPEPPTPAAVAEPVERDEDYDVFFRHTALPATPPPVVQSVEVVPQPNRAPEPVRQPAPAAAEPGERSGVILHLPGLAPAEPGPAVPVAVHRPGPDTSRTVLRPRPGHPEPAGPAGPLVLCCQCPAGHPTPSADTGCRVCGAPVPAQEPIRRPRPVLGELRLSTGEAISLDRGVLLGRHPRAEAAGPVQPHEVRLDNGRGDISGNHVEIRLDGWDVLVVDLSTNGTRVTTPDGRGTDLTRGVAEVLPAGASVHLAPDTWFRFEVPR